MLQNSNKNNEAERLKPDAAVLLVPHVLLTGLYVAEVCVATKTQAAAANLLS
jgi:hypothetical protein